MTAPAPWTGGEAERAAKAMFGNQALHRASVAMARCHPRALDYIRQAPVIVLAMTAGRVGPDAARLARSYAGPPMQMLAARGAKLREVMAFCGCAYQLRHLAPSVLHPVRWAVIEQLGQLPPSTLAQIVPSARGQQELWLRALTRWTDHCDRRAHNAWFRFDWAAIALRRVARDQVRIIDTVADLLIEAAGPAPRGGAVFDPRWSLQHALGATERWHRSLAREHAEKKTALGLGVTFTAAIDYVPYPNEPVAIDGFTFVPLRSCEDLWVEGLQMHHCVGTYSADVMLGRARIYSIQRDGRRIATVEYGPLRESSLHSVVQVKGPCNARPLKAVRDAAVAFLTQVRADADRAGPLRVAFPGFAARFSDEVAPPAAAQPHPTPQASPGLGA